MAVVAETPPAEFKEPLPPPSDEIAIGEWNVPDASNASLCELRRTLNVDEDDEAGGRAVECAGNVALPPLPVSLLLPLPVRAVARRVRDDR
jgi:hypothetical protein